MIVHHKGIEVDKAGVKLKFDIEEHKRTGTKSPHLYIYIDPTTNKRYTPYSFQHYGYRMTLNSLFKLIYGKMIQNLIPSGIKLLARIPRERT